MSLIQIVVLVLGINISSLWHKQSYRSIIIVLLSCTQSVRWTTGILVLNLSKEGGAFHVTVVVCEDKEVGLMSWPFVRVLL